MWNIVKILEENMGDYLYDNRVKNDFFKKQKNLKYL